MIDLEPYLGDARSVIAAIVRAYRRTYAINVRRFDPKVGDDGHTFGVQNWRGGLFHLEREFGKLPGISVDRPNNHLLIRLPTGVTLRPYKAHFDGDNLAFFPTSETRARVARDNADSYSFFEYSTAFAPTGLPVNALVIHHDGDNLEGLRAIYLGAPLDGQDPANGWFFSERIYMRDSSDTEQLNDDNALSTNIEPFTERLPPDVEVYAKDDRRAETNQEHDNAPTFDSETSATDETDRENTDKETKRFDEQGGPDVELYAKYGDEDDDNHAVDAHS